MSDLFFHGGGLSRLTIGFDNPNKAAVLFGCLALVFACLALRSCCRRSAFSLGGLSLLSWGGMALTFSRGAVVSFFVGMLPILFVFRQRLRRPLAIAAALVVLTLAVAAVACRGPVRLPSADASVGNRLELWRAAPRMMVDAWGGWGLGTAGDAYVGWYQPLTFHERYRTLVSSHLTWLTELGVGGRIAYCAGWLLVLGLGASRLRQRRDPLSFSVWTAFGLASSFSSVAESAVLWLVPAAVAMPSVWTAVRRGEARAIGRLLAKSLLGGAAVAFALMGLGTWRPDAWHIRLESGTGRLLFGTERPTTWIVRDLDVMGGPSYGRALRRYARQAGVGCASCGIAATLDMVPADVRRLVLCGRSADTDVARLASFGSLRDVRVLSPMNPDKWLKAPIPIPISVFCGEFDSHFPADARQPRLVPVVGNGMYLTDWPTYALEPDKEVPCECP